MDDDSSAFLIQLYDDNCRYLKEFFTIMINSRNTETHTNSIITVNMGTDFESPKHLYQNVYNTLCTELLNEDLKDNPIIKLNHNRNSFLLDVIMHLLQNASKSF
jgi:hypothetical protein